MRQIKKLLFLEPAWILLLAVPILLPGRLFSQAWYPYLLPALFLGWLLRLVHERRISVSSPILGSIVFILCWLPVNIWASADRATSWVAVGYLLYGIALYGALVNWEPARRSPWLVAWLLLLCGGGLALISPPITAWKPEFRLFRLPLYEQLQALPVNLGETIHANVLAGVLVLVLPFFIILVLPPHWTAHRWPRLLSGFMILVVASVLILTQSRGGYMAMGVAFFVLCLLQWPRLTYLIPLFAIGGYILVRSYGGIALLNELSNEEAMGGWAGRLDIWTQSWRALNDFIFTGIGIGTFTLVIPLLYPLRVNIEGFPHAHNLFLQIGIDLGAPGLVAYLLLLFNLAIALWRILRTRHSILAWKLAAGAVASLAAMLTHGLVDAVTWGTKLAFVPWILFALITLLYHQTSDSYE